MISIHELESEMKSFIADCIRTLPGNYGFRLRYWFYKKRLSACGINVSISQYCYIRNCENISIGNNIGIGLFCQLYAGGGGTEWIQIGDNVYLNSNVMLNADIGGKLIIGNNVLFGPNVVVRTSNHIFSDKTRAIKNQGHESNSIMINDDVWIAANTVIVGGVTIGRGAVIAAGSVVTRNVKEYTIVGGVPARKIGIR